MTFIIPQNTIYITFGDVNASLRFIGSEQFPVEVTL